MMNYFLKLLRKGKNHHVIGDFWAGKNSPIDVKELSKSYLKPDKTHQIEVIVGKSDTKRGVKIGCQEILFQFMIDCSGNSCSFLEKNRCRNDVIMA